MVAIIAGIREELGPDIEVLIDAHALHNVPTAIRLANLLAPYAITWFEEPCPPESYDALEQVRGHPAATARAVGSMASVHTGPQF